MPFLDGRQTFHRIKHELQLEEVPIIILSSSRNPHDKISFESQGIEFITKPDDFSELRKMVKHMLDVCCHRVNVNLNALLQQASGKPGLMA